MYFLPFDNSKLQITSIFVEVPGCLVPVLVSWNFPYFCVLLDVPWVTYQGVKG
jgi:hypothetical protein